jgi:hypothetical protein
LLAGFYLTGGTALGRFYLNHRFSEDLDFFVNADPDFKEKHLLMGKKLRNEFSLLLEQTVVYEDFARYYVACDDAVLKIEFVNDIPYRSGIPLESVYGLIDTPLNILSNKLTAIAGRDEPKDIFDIYMLARKYCFNWMRVFEEAKKKAILNEIDLEQRIKSFPVELLKDVDWFIHPFDQIDFTSGIYTLANDFILGRNNSITSGKNQIPIEKAELLPNLEDHSNEWQRNEPE